MRAKAFEQVKVTFRNENDLGVLENMDIGPNANIYIDGGLDSSVSVVVTNIGTGIYRAVWTMGDYNVDDVWELVVSGNYNGVVYSRVVKEGYIYEDATVAIPTRFMRLYAPHNTAPPIQWYINGYDLNNRLLNLKVGTGAYYDSPELGDLFYTFTNSEIYRDNNLIRVTIPLIISSTKGIYPWSLRDVTTGDAEIQTGVIDVQ